VLRPTEVLLYWGDVEVADVYEVAGYGGCGGHYGAYQVGAAVLPWRPSKLRLECWRCVRARQHVGIHADAHAAAGVAPLETGGGENFVEAFLFGLGLDAREPERRELA